MSDKTWRKTLIMVLVTGIITSSILVGYTIKLRKQCSIITYIANENDGGW